MNIAPLLTPLLYFAVIIAVTWLVARFASIIVGRVIRRTLPLAAAQAQRIVWLLIWLIGSVLAIEQLGIRSDILLVMVGLFGVGVIVAVREPLENLGAKYFSDMYAPFKVGDSITVQDRSGKVIEVNSMSTIVLADDDNNLISIPNSTFMKEVVVNRTPQAWKEVTIPITIQSNIELATFESALLKSLGKLRLHLDTRFPPVLSTRSRSPQSTELSLTLMIRRPEERDVIATEANKRITDIIETMQQRANS